MGTFKNVVAGVAGLMVTSVGTWNTLDVVLQSGTPSQPGQPAKQPRPSNPQPQPRNPVPDQNQNTPGAPRTNDAGRDRAQNDRDAERSATSGRYARPFSFQSPRAEGQFNLATRRLVQMEQRMQRSQEDLLRSLGEARRLTGTRQTEALFDVIQGMMREQAELQRYLIQSRTAWTGDLTPEEPSDGEMIEDDAGTTGSAPAQPPR
jgi:hypothetical protein